MRLWPIKLLDKLPRQQLLGQHRECCALRGLGWGRKHATVDYVFRHPYVYLYEYHRAVMEEMRRRGSKPSSEWFDLSYRGRHLGHEYSDFTMQRAEHEDCIYPEHDAKYVQECLDNLARKGIQLED